jgi:hypothetical protein
MTPYAIIDISLLAFISTKVVSAFRAVMMRIFAAVFAQRDGSAAPATIRIFKENFSILRPITLMECNSPDKAQQQTDQIRLRSSSVLHTRVNALVAIAAGGPDGRIWQCHVALHGRNKNFYADVLSA